MVMAQPRRLIHRSQVCFERESLSALLQSLVMPMECLLIPTMLINGSGMDLQSLVPLPKTTLCPSVGQEPISSLALQELIVYPEVGRQMRSATTLSLSHAFLLLIVSQTLPSAVILLMHRLQFGLQISRCWEELLP